MIRFFVSLFVLGLFFAPHAFAGGVKYYPDPVYKPINGDDVHPLADLLVMAEENDSRAQFIVADLYSKGKGGLNKDTEKASYWFQRAAKLGYNQSFVRLAAIAKRQGRPVEADKWYILGLKRERYTPLGHFFFQAREELEAEKTLTRNDIIQARKLATDWDITKFETLTED